MFEYQDLDQYTAVVLDCLKFCSDITAVYRHIQVYPEQKTLEDKRVAGKEMQPNSTANLRRESRGWGCRGGWRTASGATTPGRCGEGFSTSLTTDPSAWQMMMVAPHWRRNFTASSRQPSAHGSKTLVVDEHQVRRTLGAVNPRKTSAISFHINCYKVIIFSWLKRFYTNVRNTLEPEHLSQRQSDQTFVTLPFALVRFPLPVCYQTETSSTDCSDVWGAYYLHQKTHENLFNRKKNKTGSCDDSEM